MKPHITGQLGPDLPALASILGRPIHAVDHNHVDRRLVRRQLQSELFLERLEDVRLGDHIGVGTRRLIRSQLARGFQVDIEKAREAVLSTTGRNPTREGSPRPANWAMLNPYQSATTFGPTNLEEPVQMRRASGRER